MINQVNHSDENEEHYGFFVIPIAGITNISGIVLCGKY
jgi:hypothetical protein